MLNIRHFFNGLQIVPRSDGATAPDAQGDLAVSNVDGNLYYNNGTLTDILNTSSNTTTLTNKTISVTSNNITSTPNTAAQFNTITGNLESSVTTNTELSYVHGVTSSIQTQLNGLQPAGNYITALTGDVTASGPGSSVATLTATTNSTITTLSALSLPGSQVTGSIPGNSQNVNGIVAIINGGTGQTTANAAYGALSPMTMTGDIEYESAPGIASRLAIGTVNQVLMVSGSHLPAWSTFTALTNPMTMTGDIIYSSDNLGTPTRLPVGTSGQILEVSAGIPTWTTPASTGLPSGSTIMFAGTAASVPSGYLICDGTSYLISTYPALAAALYDSVNTTYAYGTADSLHFNVPDLEDYSLVV